MRGAPVGGAPPAAGDPAAQRLRVEAGDARLVAQHRRAERLAELRPELVIFGSGERLRFPKPEWQVGLMQRRVGLETMDIQAACRTYNILAGEGRKVAAALLIEASASKN